jgi:hypothetical protein
MKTALWMTLCLVGCGSSASSWTAQDTTNLQDIARDQAAALDLCATNAGTCNAALVRATNRGDYCAAANVLFRHGESVPDAGVQCQPRQ